MKKAYIEQVRLLIETIPFIAKESCFALKGGTAINLFYQNMPRLSVDIDLVYIDFDDRQAASTRINEALVRITSNLIRAGYSAFIHGSNNEKKIIVSNRTATIKVEPNYTLRGYVYEPKLLGICEKAEEEFGYTEMNVISTPELYGGKICAALDRQHPRDLFDIKGFFQSKINDENMMRGFLSTLLGHNRPIHELIDPIMKDQQEVFEKEFKGMTDSEFSYENHIATFQELIRYVHSGLKPYQKFLQDFVSLQIDITAQAIPNLNKLPAILWKQQNLELLKKQNSTKFQEQYEKLLNVFESNYKLNL